MKGHLLVGVALFLITSSCPETGDAHHRKISPNQTNWYPVLSLKTPAEGTSPVKVNLQLIHAILAKCRPEKNDSKRAIICCMLLLIGISNDINLNPGPIRFPCGLCSKQVRWNQKAVCCDHCDLWYHTKCIEMTTGSYLDLQDHPSISWICRDCGLPNFATSLFSSFLSIDSQNSFSTLASLDNSGDQLYPLATSSPQFRRTAHQNKRHKHKFRQLKALVVNFQGLHSKWENVG